MAQSISQGALTPIDKLLDIHPFNDLECEAPGAVVSPGGLKRATLIGALAKRERQAVPDRGEILHASRPLLARCRATHPATTLRSL